MKAVIVGCGLLLLAASIGLAQEQQQQPSDPPASQMPVLSYQTQPSEVEKAKATVWRPKLQRQVTTSGPLADLARGESLFRPLPNGTNVVYQPPDDLSLDLITRRPRGLVLFAINF